MAVPRVLICFAAVALVAAASVRSDDGVEAAVESAVLTLDAANFSDAIAKHPFIVVEFYAPWCGHCQQLAPEYEKAAAILSKRDPPIVLAKVDADDEANKELAKTYDVQGFPTIKIVRDGGKIINLYNGPRDAEGIVQYLNRLVGPATTEIKSLEEATTLINDNKFYIAGVFPEFSGEEFENFLLAAENLRTEYSFGYTLDAKFLPRGDSTVKGPIIRLFKPFDELFVDTQDFHYDALAKFIEESTMPLVVKFEITPSNQPFLEKFFGSQKSKVMFFVDYSNEKIETFKSKYQEAAELYKDLSFLIGDTKESKQALEYFGVKEENAPVIVVDGNDQKKYLKEKVEPEQILAWVKEYKAGSLAPFIKSEPIPEVNDEPVKVVVYDSVQEVVFNSKKNVLLEFYAPWCGHCKQLAPILEEVAVSLKDDADVMIAKMDATANDIPAEFEVEGFPTLYFVSASGKLLPYEGGRTAEEIIDYIQKNKDEITKTDSVKDEL